MSPFWSAIAGAIAGAFLMMSAQHAAKPARLDPSSVRVFERYAESWGRPPGRVALQGESFVAPVGDQHWFNPCVMAPKGSKLSNVTLFVELPKGFVAKPSAVWVLQDIVANGGARYSIFLGTINPDSCRNGPEQLAFFPLARGRSMIAYLVTAAEGDFEWGAFTVDVR